MLLEDDLKRLGQTLIEGSKVDPGDFEFARGWCGSEQWRPLCVASF